MRYFTTNQIRAALLLCVLAVAGWSLRYYLASAQRQETLPFDPYPADSAAMAGVDGIRAGLDSPVRINEAGLDELQRLDGIGPGLAGRIVDERRRGGPFADLDQLIRRVRGIGPATASAFGDKVVFSASDSAARGNEP